jgi:hypothetical protein
MKITEKKFAICLNEAKTISAYADRANKGSKVHSINSNNFKIKYLISVADKEGVKMIGKDFLEMCKLKRLLASDLWFNKQIDKQ